MKKSDLKKYIREIIMSEVTMVGAETDPSKVPEIAKTGTPVGVAEAGRGRPKKSDDEDVEVEDTWNKPEDDENEDEDKIDKKAQTAAKKGGSNLTKLNKVTTQLKELEKEMKD
jgi:hypothetical protein